MIRAATADAAGGTPYVDNVVRLHQYEAAHPGVMISNEQDEGSPTRVTWACVIMVGGEPKRVQRTSLGELLDVLEMIEQREADLAELQAVHGDDYEDFRAEHGIWRCRQRGGDGLEITAHSGEQLDARLCADRARRRAS